MTIKSFKNFYQAFGLVISSEIPIQELIPVSNNQKVDVAIERVDLYPVWLEQFEEGEYYKIEPNWLMVHVPEVAIFCIENGDKITIAPFEESSEDQIRLYLLGTCMSTILMQRKILPLHGSAIEIDGKAYAILGDCGAGKSTLAKAFLNRGYKLLTDDVIAVTFSNRQEPLVIPSYPQQKLWMESLNHFQLESDQLKPLIDRETKFAVPAVSQFINEKLPLAGMYELFITENEGISITPITNMNRFHTLYNQTFRNFFLEELGLMEWHFETSAKLVSRVPIYKIERPSTIFTAYDLTELILSTIKENALAK